MKNQKIVSVASGKGGVGKTLTTVNIALSARRQNYRVLILDGDMGMANVDVVLGLRPRYNINDVIHGSVLLQDIVLQGPLGVDIIPTGSGLSGLANLSLSQRVSILDQLENLGENYDVIIIDTGAGINATVLHLNSIADDIVVVTTPEPHAMTDAYAFIKVMSEMYDISSYNLLINQVVNREQGLKIGSRIAEVSERFLKKEIRVIGTIPFDDAVSRTVMKQTVGSDIVAHTRAGQAWNEIALELFDTINGSEKNRWESFVFPVENRTLHI